MLFSTLFVGFILLPNRHDIGEWNICNYNCFFMFLSKFICLSTCVVGSLCVFVCVCVCVCVYDCIGVTLNCLCYRLLDIIDLYEGQLYDLKKELEIAK